MDNYGSKAVSTAVATGGMPGLCVKLVGQTFIGCSFDSFKKGLDFMERSINGY